MSAPAGGQSPSRSGALIRCPECANILGEERGGMINSRHKHREVMGIFASICCEKCGGVWYMPPAKLLTILRQMFPKDPDAA